MSSIADFLAGVIPAALGGNDPGGIDIGDVIHWLELRQVDGTYTVYIESGTVYAVPRDARNPTIASIVMYKDNQPRIVSADVHPVKSVDLIRRAALGYAQQVASSVSGKGESVTLRQACGRHNDYHKIATIRCTRTDREKLGKDVDLTEQFTIILHPYHG